jgi:hypothetical protein
VYLGGEGATELGDWAKERPYRPRPGEPSAPGVIEGLLRKALPELGWSVKDGDCWEIDPQVSGSRPSSEARARRGAEAQTILRLALRATEAGCDALVFARDRDGDEPRKGDIERGITEARLSFPGLAIVGGLAIEMLEAWILALIGERQSETRRHPKARLAEVHACSGREQMLAVVDRAKLDAIPSDALSLTNWLTLAKKELGESP